MDAKEVTSTEVREGINTGVTVKEDVKSPPETAAPVDADQKSAERPEVSKKSVKDKTGKKAGKIKAKKAKKRPTPEEDSSSSDTEDDAQLVSSSSSSSSDSDSDSDSGKKKRGSKKRHDAAKLKKKAKLKKPKKPAKQQLVIASDSDSDADSSSGTEDIVDDLAEGDGQRGAAGLAALAAKLRPHLGLEPPLGLAGGGLGLAGGGIREPPGYRDMPQHWGDLRGGNLQYPASGGGLLAPVPVQDFGHLGHGSGRQHLGGTPMLRMGGRRGGHAHQANRGAGGLLDPGLITDGGRLGQPPLKQKRNKPARLDYKRVDQVWDQTIHNFKLQDTAEATSDAQYDEYLFHVRRTFDWEGKYKQTVVDIKSKLLREALQAVMGNIKGVSLVEDTPKLDPNMLFLCVDMLPR
jgi:hypothetical protein